MEAQIYIDLASYAHILAVAIGFGAAFLTDMLVLARLGQKVDQSFLTTLRNYHGIISFSVMAMWITGLIMIYIRAGFDFANFSPKLIAKIVIVTVLTVNAQIIGNVFMPMIEGSVGKSLLWLPVGTQIKLAGIGATSTASWMLALVLGSSKVPAASGPMVFVLRLPVVYGGALVLAAVAVKLLHSVGKSVVPQRRSVATSSPLSFDMTIARDYRSATRA